MARSILGGHRDIAYWWPSAAVVAGPVDTIVARKNNKAVVISRMPDFRMDVRGSLIVLIAFLVPNGQLRRFVLLR